MTKNEQLLNYIATRATESDKMRRSVLQIWANNLPATQDALSDETARKNVDMAISLQDLPQKFSTAITELQIYNSVHRIFMTKVQQRPQQALAEMAEWLQTVINERVLDMQYNATTSVAGVQAYLKIQRFTVGLIEDATF